MNKENLVPVGYTKKTHGSKGEVKVFIEDTYLEDFINAEVIFLNIKGKPVPYFIENIRGADTLVLKLEDVDSPGDAVPITAKEIFLRKEGMLAGEESEDGVEALEFGKLQGYLLVDSEKGKIGQIQEIREFPQQEMAVIQYGEKELLVPLHRSLIEEIDEKKKIITLQLPEGLLNL